MSKWPKEWVEALSDMECRRKGPFDIPDHDDRGNAPRFILDRLNQIGALKEPPKPREYLLCVNCLVAFTYLGAKLTISPCRAAFEEIRVNPEHQFVKVREVLDE